MSRTFKLPSLTITDKIENEEARKEVYLRYFLFYLAVFSLLYTVISFSIGYKEGAVICFSTFVCLLFLSFSKKLGFSMVFRANVLVLVGTLDVYFNALFTGAIQSPVTA